MPNTLDAQIALGRSLLADGQKRARRGDRARSSGSTIILDAGSEKQVLAKLGALLTAKDHWARAEHLMMNDRASGVERLLGS